MTQSPQSDDGVPASDKPQTRPSAVVGIGASVGGLEALKRFFSRIPDVTGVAFVIVPHASQDWHAALPAVLAEHAGLRVEPARDGMPVEADVVYVTPPDQHFHIESGLFKALPRPGPRVARLPVDTFFRSLGRDQKAAAIGVVLSGHGSDGTQGIREIKECGGMTMAQLPEEAACEAMPRWAVQTRQADYVLPAAELPDALLRYVRHNELFVNEPIDTAGHTGMIEEILHILDSQTEHDFRDYKHATLLRRIRRRMGLRSLVKIDEYVHLLRDRPEEIWALSQDLLVSVTAFFRNPEAWEVLRREVLGGLLAGRQANEPLRIWVPACATGEEAYSFAMLASEALKDHGDIRVQIFATDISNKALQIARAATYPESVAADVGPQRLGRHFTPHADGYRINKSLREMVVFAGHDLNGDPPFSRLDLISCRNLMIYLEPEAQEQILKKFHFALKDGGSLFLGTAETPARLPGGFKAIDAKWRIYRRVATQLASEPRTTPRRVPVFAARDGTPERGPGRDPNLKELFGQLLLKDTSVAALFVNDQLIPVHLAGSADRYLQFPEGDQRYGLLDLARPGLHLNLRAAVQRAIKENAAVEFRAAHVKQADGGSIAVSGVVRPVEHGEERRRYLFIRLEQEAGPRPPQVPDDEDREAVVRDLERELAETRRELGSTIEQVELANEELKAAHEEAMSVNEELQSGNEELEASKEELQSLNQELTSLNVQLEEKLNELAAANNDLDNLLSSTKIAVVFLDTRFHIRNFTPEAVKLFSLIRTDVGRPISDLVHKFTDSQLLEHARSVLASLSPVSHEVRTGDGRYFFRRMLPYRTSDNRIEGVVATFHDITELKAAQHKLADRERQLRLVTNSLPALISFVDSAEHYRFVNAAYQDWFGLSAADVVGKTVWEVLGDEAYRQIRDSIRRALAGERVTWEGVLPYRLGGPRHVLVEYVPHKSAAGEVLGYYALIQDISARKRADEAIARSEREYRAIFELAGSGKAQADPATGRFLRVNRRYCQITGYSEGELFDKTYTEITHPEDRDSDAAAILSVLEGRAEHWTSEKRYVRKDGSIVWVLVSGTIIRDDRGRPDRMLATIQDINDQKLAEQRLFESRRRFQILADNISQLTWTAERLGWCDWYNQRWYEYTGATPEEAAGRGWERFVHPDHLDRVNHSMRAAHDTGVTWEDTFPMRRRDGTDRWFLGRAVPIRDQDGNVTRWFGTHTDVTDLMEMERALKEADRRKDEFIATLAHELRNPLAPIRTGLELLRRAEDRPELVAQTCEMLRRQADQLVRLVDDLMDVSRISRGKVELKTCRVVLAEVIESAREATRPLFEEAGHRLDLDTAEEPLALEGDPTRLAQVFSNLLSNAAKFTPPQGEVALIVRRDGGEAVVTVRDHGVGIAPDMLNHIFDLFAQAEPPMDASQGGLGIGLTLVKSLVEMHGGCITARSEGLGHGSEFEVRLPLAEPSAVPGVGRPSTGTADTRHGLRVLIVDDNHAAADTLGMFLAVDGIDVRVAYDGTTALAVGDEYAPHVVLLDLGMPGMNGFDTARTIRQRSWGATAVLFALTGWGQEDDLRRTSDAGFDRHLVKPVDPNELSRVLAELRR